MLGVDPQEVYISESRRGGYTYHTTTDCPNLPGVYKTLRPTDPEFTDVIKRDECSWCRYDTLGELELSEEDD